MSKSSSMPIDDLTYDVITVLQHKAKALAAYDKYIGDALAEDDGELQELFIQMRKHDEENVLALKEVLAHRLDEDLGYDDEEELNEEDGDVDIDDYDDEEVESTDEADDAQRDTTVPSSPRRGESNQRQR
jgi:hypothetical protein